VVLRYIGNFYAAFEHDKNTAARVALIENDFTRFDPPLLAERAQPPDLRVRQSREHRVELFGGFGHND
jgi:hypothetical protein